VLRQATLHNLIPMSYDISSWESFVLLISADLECPSADTAKKYDNTINNNQKQ